MANRKNTRYDSTDEGHGDAVVNLYETPKSYEIQMPMPGVKPKDVSVTAQGNIIILQWETKTHTPKNAKQVRNSMQYGKFEQCLTLPAVFKAKAAKAHLSRGLLTVLLPKVEGAKATSIKIKGGQSEQRQIEVGQANQPEQGALHS